MKILVLSSDKQMINDLSNHGTKADFIFLKENTPLWTIIEKITSNPISLIIVDDDHVRPNSERVIKMIKQVKKNAAIVFITSDMSIELGKMISQLGIDFYGHKPLTQEDLSQVLSSVLKAKAKQLN